MKKSLFLFAAFCAVLSAGAQPYAHYDKPVKPVRNVIVMIPDGTSTSVLAATRWYKFYNDSTQSVQKPVLNLDPYLCGLIGTFESDSPIPDSAPSMSAYMTGMPEQANMIAVYPAAHPGEDLLAVDSTQAYRPLATLMEAARQEQGKATGVVVTVDFCHATPAACTSHDPSRDDYPALAAQMVSSGLDVVFGGGDKVLTDAMRETLRANGTTLIEQDAAAWRAYNDSKPVWALFAPGNMAYDLDRDNAKEPSLAEMTDKALGILSQNPNGFMLMVEGSKVDQAAHANDPVGVITEMLAFDKAFGVALDFARRNGNTAIVVMPDHGNSAMTFGDAHYDHYNEKGLDSVYMNISKMQRTADGLEKILLAVKPNEIPALFKQYTGIDLTPAELQLLVGSRNYKQGDYTEVAHSVNMLSSIARILTAHTHFAFISGNHTGEDVFLAACNPNGELPVGRNTNIQINAYMADLLGLPESLTALTDEIYVPYTSVFTDAKCSISSDATPVLTVQKGKHKLRIPAYGSTVYLDGQAHKLGSVAVYVARNKMFYVPRELGKLL